MGDRCGYREEMMTTKMATWRDVLWDCWEYYNIHQHGAGGWLHIVLDDGNCRNGDVESCLESAIIHHDPACEALARRLLTMSQTQREELCKHYDLYRMGAEEPPR
jgi:Zn-finger protein